MSADRPLGNDDPVSGMPARPVVLLSCPFTATTVADLRHAVAAQVVTAGLTGDQGDDFVLAVHELVTNAVRHGGGAGELVLHRDDDTLTCEIVDHGGTPDSLPVRLPAANVPGGRGLWLAHHLTGTLLLTHRPGGTTATVNVCLTPEQPGTADSAASTHIGLGSGGPTEGTQP
ncbi:MAG TPA: ATP-binding protein [Micromonospora sp.]